MCQCAHPLVLHIPFSLASVCPHEPLGWYKPRRFLGRKAIAELVAQENRCCSFASVDKSFPTMT